MSEEKRVIEGYEVKQSLYIGGVEVILAENMATDEPYMVCNCNNSNPFGLEIYDKAAVSADYIETLQEFLKRAGDAAERVKTQRAERGLPPQMLTEADYIPGGLDEDMEGKVVLIRADAIVPEHRSADHQLGVCRGGNGSRPRARGSAVFVENLYTGKTVRWERWDIAGVMDPAKLPDWAKDKLAALAKPAEKESVRGKLAAARQVADNQPKVHTSGHEKDEPVR